MRRRHRIVAGASTCPSHSVQGARRHLVGRSSTRSESRAWWLVRLSRRRRTTFRVPVFKKTHSQDRDRCVTLGTDRAIESPRWDTVGGLRYTRILHIASAPGCCACRSRAASRAREASPSSRPRQPAAPPVGAMPAMQAVCTTGTLGMHGATCTVLSKSS